MGIMNEITAPKAAEVGEHAVQGPLGKPRRWSARWAAALVDGHGRGKRGDAPGGDLQQRGGHDRDVHQPRMVERDEERVGLVVQHGDERVGGGGVPGRLGDRGRRT